MKSAVYPGSFDPLTFGHIDLVERGLKIFDSIYILVGKSTAKGALFTPDERTKIIKEFFRDNDRVKVESSAGLTVDFARKHKINVLLRGIRATSDFEYEFQMAITNREIAPEIETVYLPTNPRYYYISSHLVKEIAGMGGDVKFFVPPLVKQYMEQKFPEKK